MSPQETRLLASIARDDTDRERFDAELGQAKNIRVPPFWPIGISLALADARDEKIKDALCGPYGRFFNEGTD